VGCRLTVCVTRKWAGVDSAWEQRKLEARKMLENAAESPASSACFVGRGFEDSLATAVTRFQHTHSFIEQFNNNIEPAKWKLSHRFNPTAWMKSSCLACLSEATR